jgi:uncharacterized protein YjbI with pentapeptide repeats
MLPGTDETPSRRHRPLQTLAVAEVLSSNGGDCPLCAPANGKQNHSTSALKAFRLAFSEPGVLTIGAANRNPAQLFLSMANPEHIALLQQGTAIWNDWRTTNPELVPDFDGAKLSGADLRGANLSRATLLYANLSEADLSEADLSGADLSRANLSEANLSRANLSEADLSEADLSEADLSGAILQGANLSRANLSGADLRGARLDGAKLSGADLRGAKLSRATLLYANLSGADLSEAVLSGANLSEANLSRANLSGAHLFQADLFRANLSEANLSGAILEGADLSEAVLSGANLSGADLRGARLGGAKLSGANLSGANLSGADLSGANLSGADLSGANLNRTELIRTDFSHADLTESSIYGIAAWDVKLTADTRQENLIITPPDQPVITVDNIKVAQFVYLLLNNEEIRDVIDTITSKAVLILGRFSHDRKPILNALRNALRNKGFLPIVFDFERPKGRDFTETIKTLAGMSCFVIADITNPRSAPLELQATVPDYMIPFVPILQDGESGFSMFSNLQNKYDWVFDTLGYDSSQSLIANLDDAVINPALEKRHELELRKARDTKTRHVSDYRKHP